MVALLSTSAGLRAELYIAQFVKDVNGAVGKIEDPKIASTIKPAIDKMLETVKPFAG